MSPEYSACVIINDVNAVFGVEYFNKSMIFRKFNCVTRFVELSNMCILINTFMESFLLSTLLEECGYNL